MGFLPIILEKYTFTKLAYGDYKNKNLGVFGLNLMVLALAFQRFLFYLNKVIT